MKAFVLVLFVLAMVTNIPDLFPWVPVGIVAVTLGILVLGPRSAVQGIELPRVSIPVLLLLVFYGVIVVSNFQALIDGRRALISPVLLCVFTLVVLPALSNEPMKIERILLLVIGALGIEAVLDVLLFKGPDPETGELVRSSGFNMHPNVLSVYYTSIIPYVYYFYKKTKQKYVQIGLLLLIALMAYAVTITASRSGLILVAISILLCLFVKFDRYVVGGVSFMGIVLLVSGRLWALQRFETDGYSLRTTLIERGIQLTVDHPIFGIGFGNMFLYTSDVANYSFNLGLHNTYLRISSELGIPMLLLFLGALATCALQLYRMEGPRSELAKYAAVSLAILALSGLSNHFVFVQFVMVVPFIILLYPGGNSNE